MGQHLVRRYEASEDECDRFERAQERLKEELRQVARERGEGRA